MAVDHIEITNFIRENVEGLYIDYLEGCFNQNRSHSFLIGLANKPTKGSNKLSRITEIHLQDSSTPRKVWSRFYGSTEPKEELFYNLYKLLLNEVGDEILKLEKRFPPIEPYMPQRAEKAYEELLGMGAWV